MLFIFDIAFPAAILMVMLSLRCLRLPRALVAMLAFYRHCQGRSAQIRRTRSGIGRPFPEGIIGGFRRLLEKSFRKIAIPLRVNDQQFSRGAGDERIFCSVPFDKLVVNCDGRVQCGSSIESPIIGDLNAQTLGEIWNGKPLQDIRAEILAGRTSRCGKCRIHGLAKDYHLKEKPSVVMEKGPETVWIEPIAVCNLDCPVRCGNKSPKNIAPISKRERPLMKFEEFRRIIGMLGGNVRRIGLFNYGEPLLHPRIVDMINLAKAVHPQAFLFLNSNGTRLEDARLRAGLASSGLDELHLSIDGCDQETYGIYRRGGDFGKIIASIRDLAATKGARPRIQWQYILFSWNDSDRHIAKAIGIAKDIGVDKFVFQTSATPLTNSRRFSEGTPRFRGIAPFLIDSRRFRYRFDARLHAVPDGFLLRFKNTGDIRWNSQRIPWGRCVQLVAYSSSAGSERNLLYAQPIQRDFEPGEQAEFHVSAGVFDPSGPGGEIHFDLRLGGEFYFEERGNTPLKIPSEMFPAPGIKAI